jgi:glycosyltransferase involved in cell wall biosynthesis
MADSETLTVGARAPSSSRRPRSVLMVTPRWDRVGGVATHVQASAAALAARGVEVLVLAARVESGSATPGVRVLHGARLLDRDSDTSARLGDALEPAADVVHLHQVDDPSLVQALRQHAPVVISAHGYTACPSGVYYFAAGQECTRAHGPGCVPNMLLRGCAHTRDPRPLPKGYARAGRGLQALRQADLVVSYSSAVERHLAANGIARRTLIPLFTTLTPPQGSGHAERRRVVFAGRIVAAKGIGVLIDAAREVEAEFVVCGDGWQLAEMRAKARKEGLQERVRFTGWLPPEQLGAELAEASVVAMPSLWPEPFGLVGIESLSAGRPVVASATGGVADWLDDGVSGLCVPPGDSHALAAALDGLLADPERQRAMGEAGRRAVAERFTAERHTAALLESYGTARARWESTR